MSDELLKDIDKRMSGAVDNFKTELQGLRTGRASADLLAPVMVEADLTRWRASIAFGGWRPLTNLLMLRDRVMRGMAGVHGTVETLVVHAVSSSNPSASESSCTRLRRFRCSRNSSDSELIQYSSNQAESCRASWLHGSTPRTAARTVAS